MTLGDDHPCKISGIGIVWMQMFDGMMQTVTNMKHVPDLKRNLASLSYLERNGYSFSSHARSGVLNISNRVLMVMRGRRLENNLYRLEGSVMIKNFDIVAVA